MDLSVKSVKATALELLVKHNNAPDEMKTHYHGVILDWTDYYNEAFEDKSSEEALHMRSDLAQLWIDLAGILAMLRQYKQAVQVYEDALKDSVVAGCAEIFTAYAGYFKDREKPANAQKVYIRALSASLAQSEVDEVWKSFFAFMLKSGAELQSVSYLYEAVCQQVEDKNSLSAPSPEVLQLTATPAPSAVAAASEVKPEERSVEVSGSVPMEVVDASREAAHVAVEAEMKAEEVQETPDEEEVALPELLDLDTAISALPPLELLTRFQKKPPLLFVAASKEPMTKGIAALSPEERSTLEAFFGVKLSPYVPSSYVSRIERVLDILEALWTAQALKERHFEGWLGEIQKVHMREEADMHKTWQHREARIGSDSAAVRNQGDMNRFLNRCAAQLDVLHAVVNRTQYLLLLEHVRTLVTATLPYFTEDVYSQLAGCEGAFDEAAVRIVEMLRRVVSALLSLRIRAAPAPGGPPSSGVRDYYGPAAAVSSIQSGPSASAMRPVQHSVPASMYAPQTHAAQRGTFSSAHPLGDLSDSKKKSKRRKVAEVTAAAVGTLNKYGPGSAAPVLAQPYIKAEPPTQQTSFAVPGVPQRPAMPLQQIVPPQITAAQPMQILQESVPIAGNSAEVDKAKLPLLQKLAMMIKTAKK